MQGEEVDAGLYEEMKVVIRLGRLKREEFTLDAKGFTLQNDVNRCLSICLIQVKNFHDKKELNAKYIPEIQNLANG